MNKLNPEDNEFISEFIKYYKLLPALWNKKCKYYHHPTIKQKSYLLLLKKYREHYPTSSLDNMKKKLSNMRTSFRRCYQKKNTHEPVLYWYKDMSFILGDEPVEYQIDVESSYAEMMNEEESERSITKASHESEEDGQDASGTEDAEYLDVEYITSDIDNEPCSPILSAWVNGKEQNARDTSTPVIHKTRSQANSSKAAEDEFDSWGKVMAAELRKLDKKQQVFAKKAITDILMEGQLGLLNKDSVQINKRTEEGTEI